jgi:hypothetical protein
MKKLLLVSMTIALLSGCKTRVEGQLNVTKEIKLREFSGEKIAIRVGTYTADLSPNGKEKIALRLNNDNNQRFNFAIPTNVKIPDNGSVKLTAVQVNQAADVNITVATQVTDGPTQEGYSQCTYQMPMQYCYPSPAGTICHIEYQTVFGQQWVRFFVRTTDKHLTLDVSEVAATEMSAQFIGSSNIADRIILNQSLCH